MANSRRAEVEAVGDSARLRRDRRVVYQSPCGAEGVRMGRADDEAEARSLVVLHKLTFLCSLVGTVSSGSGTAEYPTRNVEC